MPGKRSTWKATHFRLKRRRHPNQFPKPKSARRRLNRFPKKRQSTKTQETLLGLKSHLNRKCKLTRNDSIRQAKILEKKCLVFCLWLITKEIN